MARMQARIREQLLNGEQPAASGEYGDYGWLPVWNTLTSDALDEFYVSSPPSLVMPNAGLGARSDRWHSPAHLSLCPRLRPAGGKTHSFLAGGWQRGAPRQTPVRSAMRARPRCSLLWPRY